MFEVGMLLLCSKDEVGLGFLSVQVPRSSLPMPVATSHARKSFPLEKRVFRVTPLIFVEIVCGSFGLSGSKGSGYVCMVQG